MKLDPFISELLFEHDCVIVEDFGGFITSRKPAAINPALHLLAPPSKVIAFNSFLKQNDGILANYIARQNGISYGEACNLIASYVRQSLSQINEGGRLRLENIGILYQDQDRNLQFLPDQNANYLVSSFGMAAVHSPLIKREEDAIEPAVTLKQVHRRKTDRKGGYKWKIIEVVPAAAVLTFLMMVPPALDHFNSNLASLLPFSRMNEYISDFKGETEGTAAWNFEYPSPFEVPPTQVTNSYSDSAPANVIPQMEQTGGDVMEASVAETKSQPAVEASPIIVKPTEVSAPVSTQQYYIVGGCFRVEENADKFVAELVSKGLDAERIGTNSAGLHMVSVFKSESIHQATDALPTFRSSVAPSVWLMKK